MKRFFTLIIATGLFTGVYAQPKTTGTTPPALSAIKEADLRRDIFELAGDAFRGRRAGTIDEFRAAAWVAQRAQEAGLKPAGADGTYFQFYNIRRTRTADNGTFIVNGNALALWKAIWPTTPMDTHVDGQITLLASIADTTQNLQGKIVAIKIVAPRPLPAAGMSLYGFRYTSSAIRQMSTIFRNKGVAALILVADDITEGAIAFIGHNYQSGGYALEGPPPAANRAAANAGTFRGRNMPVFLADNSFVTTLSQSTNTLKADFVVEHFLYPSVNVIAKAVGSDPVLKNEYVLYSGHHDHDGVGPPVNRDSIWNGADDNASVTVGMLAIGRAWVAKPGKRSALFVWHGAEERGLLGSRYYAAHPTVKKESIVAVLNGDMIGRNALDSAALLGSTLPHRNSTTLVKMAMQANAGLTHFKVDTTWDSPAQPEGWYFRSDHLPYAQAGIPAIFFTSLLHPDYHTPNDGPEGIVIAKLAKMTEWMYYTGWLVSQAPAKVTADSMTGR